MNPYNMYALVKQTIKRRCSSWLSISFWTLSSQLVFPEKFGWNSRLSDPFGWKFQPLRPHPNLKCATGIRYRVPSFPLYKEAVRTSGCSQRCQHHVRCEVVAKVSGKKCWNAWTFWIYCLCTLVGCFMDVHASLVDLFWCARSLKTSSCTGIVHGRPFLLKEGGLGSKKCWLLPRWIENSSNFTYLGPTCYKDALKTFLLHVLFTRFFSTVKGWPNSKQNMPK